MRLTFLSFLSLAGAVAADMQPATLHIPENPFAAEADQDQPAGTGPLTFRRTTLDHYGEPPEGCEKDEKAFQIQGIPGGICAPMCTDFLPCPKDVPDGVTASPTCALKDQTGTKYCVLLCEVGGGSPDDADFPGAGDPLGDDQCGEATCQEVPGQGVGVCTYS